MHDLIHEVRRLRVSRRPARLQAPALIDRHVDDDGPVRHPLQVFASNEMRCPRAGNQHRPNHEVRPLNRVQDVVPIAEERRHVLGHDVVEITKPIEVHIEEEDVGSKAGGDAGRVRTDHASTEHHDRCGSDARHAGQQNAAAIEGPFQVLRPFLNAHAPGHFAHGREQRQAAARVLNRFVSHRRDAGLHDGPGEHFIRREVEEREHRLPAAHERPLVGQRLLDLHDHLGPLPDIRFGGDDLGTVGGVLFVADAAAGTGSRLNEYGVPGTRQLLDAGGHHRHAVFVRLDLLGDADDHGPPRVRSRKQKALLGIGGDRIKVNCDPNLRSAAARRCRAPLRGLRVAANR